MSNDNLTLMREVINSCYERGLAALKRGDAIGAKKLFYSAAENTLLLAKCLSGQERARLIQRADELCAFSEAIDARFERTEPEQNDEQSIGVNKEAEEETQASIHPSTVSGITFDDVVGLDEVKNEIRRLAIYPREHPEIYERFKKKRSGGILLYGVPGTGKTMIANAIANELGAVFYSVKCSDILSKWFGEAEQNIKSLFEEAKKNPISVIFFDEFDALGTKRDTDSSSMKRIIPELLVGIQSAEESDNTLVVIAATNRPWDIDSAFLRPGRFNLSIHIPLPDSKARWGMIDAALSGVPKANDLDIQKIVDLSEGFSGADIIGVCEKLKDCAIERIINEGGDEFITNDDVIRIFYQVHSSVRKEDLMDIERYRKGDFYRV